MQSTSSRKYETSFNYVKLNEDQLSFTLEKKLEIYPFHWTFTCLKLSPGHHLALLRYFLVAPLLSTVNSLENKYTLLLKRLHSLESSYKEKLHSEVERLKFNPYVDEPQSWTKAISLDDMQLDLFPQLRVTESVNHIMSTITNARFKSKY
jgi:hypothetical protein